MAKCGAKARSTGKPCQRTGMANGRCMMHGGMTPAVNVASIKHGFYSKGYTEEEKKAVETLKVGNLEAELAAARITLQRAFAAPQFMEDGKTPNEHYRPDIIERQLMLIGRLEKQHYEISQEGNTDAPKIDGFVLVPYEATSTDNSD